MCFFHKNYSKIFNDFNECDIKHRSNYNIEYAGMFYQDRLHGYGYEFNHKNQTIAFGIFKKGKLYKNLGDIFDLIKSSVGYDSKMISTSVFGEGVYIGEAISPRWISQ